VYTRPPSIDDSDIVAVLAQWGVAATAVTYRAVGFGSHHWDVTAGGSRWFLTVDDLVAKDGARLGAALETARRLRDAGRRFVIAPVPSERNELVVPIDDGYVAALYGYVEGECFDYGEYDNDEERRDVLRILASLHTAPTHLGTVIEDFALPHREQLVDDLPWGSGPYSERARAVLAAQREHVATELGRYDKLAAVAATHAADFVVTHGEPHRANTIVTPKGRVLIDWDTALVAPRERDLWMVVDAGDPLLAEYEANAGAAVRPSFFALYALQWDLMEVAGYLAFFRADHEDTADAAESWKNYLHYIGAD
jgi:spectinomycin phosphotransferase